MSKTTQLRFKDDSFYSIVKDGNKGTILYGDDPVMAFDLTNHLETRRAVIYLINIDVSINWIAKALGFHRQTITNWRKIYMQEGIEALDHIRKGPKKITSEIIAFIIAKYKELDHQKNYKKNICAQVKKNFNIDIHWRSICQILVENGINISDRRYNRKKKNDQPQQNIIREAICEHAGLFFIYGFLNKFNFTDFFSKVQKMFKNAHYKAEEYLFGLYMLFAANMIDVEENIKMHEDKKLHLLLGLNGLPSLRSFRRYLPQLIEQWDAEKMQQQLTKNYFLKNPVADEIYIDGHFMPYNGQYNTFSGYNPIRRFVQKGRSGYFLHNGDGRPFYYILSDGYQGFREYLLEISQKINSICRNKKKRNILLIFDRGGWGKTFCADLAEKIRFICWRTGKSQPAADSQWKKILIYHRGNEYGEQISQTIEATEKVEPGKNKNPVHRYIFIRKEDKVSLAYSNDPDRSLEELVLSLTGRWGLQENVFKSLKKIGIDRISSYQYEKYPAEWLLERGQKQLVKNPELKILDEKILKIKKEIVRIQKQPQFATNDVKTNTTAVRKKRQLIWIISRKEKKIASLEQEHKALPEKIYLKDLIESKGIVRLNSEKKRFMDFVKVISYNIQQDIVDAIRPVYNNERDINMFVRQLLNRNARLSATADCIKIHFEKFHSPRKNRALNFLIELSNEHKIRHPILNKKLFFCAN